MACGDAQMKLAAGYKESTFEVRHNDVHVSKACNSDMDLQLSNRCLMWKYPTYMVRMEIIIHMPAAKPARVDA